MKYATEIKFDFNNTMTIFIDNIEPNSVILEFGPASGRLTRYLKEEKKCDMYIVELDEEAGKIAAQSSKDYVIGDIQDYVWVEKFANIKFDYILFADVLEHLTEAANVVKEAAKLLKPTGQICLSVPNIAHNSVIIDMINNKFEYKATGIMDNTHVHFYTKDSLDLFVKECGLYIEKRFGTYTQVGLNEFDNSYENMPEFFKEYLKSRKYGELYQLVYVISKNPKAKNEDYIVEYADYQYVQIFLDYKGKGYVEHSKWYIHSDEKTIMIQINDIHDANKIRIDPANFPCIVLVKKVEGIRNGKASALEFDSSNAVFIKNNKYIFSSVDSQIHYKLSEDSYDCLIIEMEITSCRDDDLDVLESVKCSLYEREQELLNIIQEKEQEISKYKEENLFYRCFVLKKPINLLYTAKKTTESRLRNFNHRLENDNG